MPRFFFDTFDGEQFYPDKTGQELPDIEAARIEAQKALPDMVSDALPDADRRSFVVNVRNEAGKTVLRAALSLVIEQGPFNA
ncbi:hypothetical protein [Microvirga sp. VF16]|uniref:DUF6894 family protein n=1 Tax=Microvirga sp. VF16 TaxID=2807101 RepID=UPI00193E2C96|nr:hypothetical protein [Microvirga sp. VF16]QRM33915.1 hypothetical protein JO965_38890 [Microvirga sp. VF16]